MTLAGSNIPQEQETVSASKPATVKQTEEPDNKDNQPTSEAAITNVPTLAAPKPHWRLNRWFELQSAILQARYRFADTGDGIITTNALQHKETFKARFKFDENGHYSINAFLATGRRFIATWNNTGVGTGGEQMQLALKQLYFDAEPVKGLKFQYGGLAINRGESSEATTYDDDGYIVGERVSIAQPDRFFFDEVSITYAYLGDLNTPNLNKRYHRLKQSNYHQFLFTKKIGKRVAVSADYTFQSGVETLHQAIRVKASELHVVDSVLFEDYERVDVKPDYGFVLSVEKALTKKLTLGGGYAQIDPNFGGLNSDRYGIGRRVFASFGYQISPEFTFTTFATTGIANNDVKLPQRTVVNVMISYNLLKSLQRLHLF